MRSTATTFMIALLVFSFHSLKGQESNFSRFALVGEIDTISFDAERPYYIIEWKDEMPARAEVVRQLDHQTAIIRVYSPETLSALKHETRVARANDEWKLSSKAILKNSQALPTNFILLLERGIDLKFLYNNSDRYEVIHFDKPSNTVVINATGKLIREKLLHLKEVIFVDIEAEPKTEISIIGYKRSFHGLSAVDYGIPGANGKNIVVGVKEQMMEANDLDLHMRVLPSPVSSNNITVHATVIAAIIGGAGNSFYDGRGIANGCSFFPTGFSNIFPDDAAMLNTNNVSVQNHSYGTVIQQFYGAEAVSYDKQTWENKNLLHVFSAGNQGTAAAGEGPYAGIPGFANSTGNFKMAKNVMTIGAIDNKGNIPGESSAGPAYDGRIAPHLVALGPNGTSDAAAIVSGTVAVMQQVYADSNTQNLPPASLIKALLYNNADDIGNLRPDFKTGYGSVNSFASIRALQQKHYDGGTVGHSQQWTKNISIPPGAARVKVTLCWTDSASLPNNFKALINDLDLEVMENTSGIVYQPWVLNSSPHPDSLGKIAIRKRDSLNTAEQVSIDLPAAGVYSIRVTGTSVPGTEIPFHVAYTVDTLNSFIFLNPQHTSDINTQEDPVLDIRWKTFVADANETGDLYLSYDGGNIWEIIKENHSIASNNYQWQINDTSSRAWLKMETAFGTYFSNPFMISKVTKLNVDFLCADSFRISWNRHIDADGYTLFTLTDSPYLKQVLNVTDTFVTLSRITYPSLIYAVQPSLMNGIPAARSVAQDISLQGVACFYRSFYYTLMDENVMEMALELSLPTYVDSLFFEEVSAYGQLLRTVGNLRTNVSTVYTHRVPDMPPGTSYWRVRIKLKNGAFVYTDVYSIITSGKKYIVFYPNPVRQGDQVYYILRQTLPPGCRLVFFDPGGRRILELSEINNATILANLPAGLLIYVLQTSEGKVLQTGKLVVGN